MHNQIKAVILACGAVVLACGMVNANEDGLQHSKAALADGRYLEALHLAGEAYQAGVAPEAAALVRARAADLGGASRRRTEALYFTALDHAAHKGPVLGYLTLFYLQSGQTRKARDTEAAFIAACRYNCARFKHQIHSAWQMTQAR